MKFVYINGSYYPKNLAALSVDDRGVVFGDALYESVTVHDGKLIDFLAHLDRLYDAMEALHMRPFLKRNVLSIPILELYRRDKIKNGLLYMQVSRGIYPRSHPFPKQKKKGSLFMYFKSAPTLVPNRHIKMFAQEDVRSSYCSIKSTALLPNILAKQKAIELGGDEVLFKRGDELIEGASCNFFLVQGGKLYTCPEDGRIVPGTTRERLLALAKNLGYEVVLKAPSYTMLKEADEAFVSHASNGISHVKEIDGLSLTKNQSISKKLFEVYCETVPKYTLAS